MSDPRLARPSWRGRTNVDALTIACVEHAEKIGGHEFVVTQGSYNAGGVSASAGTHDRGGVVDLRWCGHNACIVALRKAGMAAWHRDPNQGPWPHHVHAVVIGHPFLSSGAANQVTAYLNGRNGLANNAPDDGPRLVPIPRPVWPWPPEDDMTPELQAAFDKLNKRLDNERERDIAERERDRRRQEQLLAEFAALRRAIEAQGPGQ
jgi:hypothetical protein